MKLSKVVLAFVALVSIGIAASAQQPGAESKPAAGSAVLPKGKVAFINTGVFQEKIFEYRARLEALNRQFEPRIKEVQGLGERIQSLEQTIKAQSQQNVLSPAKLAEMSDQLETMKRQYKHKQEDLEADAGKARDQALRPFTEKLGAFAKEYTARRGIIVLWDLANAMPNTVLWFDQRADVTNDFIAEYNKANPAAGAAAVAQPPKP